MDALYATFESRVSLLNFPLQDNILPSTTMSDYDDDMDVDAPAARDLVVFNSDNVNTKGKRSTANLPVEAEDSLPW